MPRGSKEAYTDRQKRKAEHIAEGYEDRGMSEKHAKEIGWATVNKQDGGGRKSGSGRASSHEERSKAAKKGWETRRRKGNA